MIMLSIIIPVYNAENYLYLNVNSILSNDYDKKKYEIILVNDGSTDDSGDICLRLSKENSNIIYIESENKGVSSARNIGLKYAKGELITFIDADDYVEKDYVMTIIENGVHNDICVLNNFLVKQNLKKKEKKWIRNFFDFSKEGLMRIAFESKINAPWDKVYRRKIIENNSISFPEDLNMGEDLIFNLQYINNVNRICVIDKCVYNHTINIDGLCNRRVTKLRYKEYFLLYNYAKKYSISNNSLYLLNESFLRIIYNYVGKLCKNGISSKEINQLLNSCPLFEIVVNDEYKGIKNKIRKLILKNRLYMFCLLFSK